MEFENINEAEQFLNKKESGRVLGFDDFVKESLNEDGYGQLPFFFAKNGDSSNYFFKISEGSEEKGFVFTIAKFAKFSQPSEMKSDYGVLSLTELKVDELDQAVIDKGLFHPSTAEILPTDGMFKRIMDQIAICINDYLQKNPKISKFYDEMQATLQIPEYDNKFALALDKWPGGNEVWKMQTMEKGKMNIISK